MYVARYGNETDAVDQVLVMLPLFCRASANGEDHWQSRWARIVCAAITTAGLEASWRISIADRRIDRQLLLIAPNPLAGQLAPICETMLGLNAIVPGSVESCADRLEHDRRRSEFPPHRAWMRGVIHELAAGWVGCDFRLALHLGALCAQALTFGWDISVQFNIRPLAVIADQSEILRKLRKNLVHLQAERNLPANLVEQQAALIERFERSDFIVDEYLGANSPNVLSAATGWLRRRFSISTGRFGFDLPIEFNEDLEIPIETGFHTSYFHEIDPRTTVAQTLTQAEIVDLLCWEPAIDARALVVNAVSGGDEDVLQRLERQLDRIEAALGGRGAVDACTEMRKAIEIHRADPPFALAKARSILEEIINRLYRERHPKAAVKPLFNMIEDLINLGDVFPKNIATYLHAVRVIGNLVVHKSITDGPPVTVQDVEIGLLMILSVIEWYLFRNSTGR